VARLFKILLLVRNRRPGRTLHRRDLADACACDERTIQRDIRLLRDQIHVPIEWDPAANAYRITEKGWAFPLVEMTLEDAMALALARGLLAGPGFPHQKTVIAALDKATANLSPALRKLLTQTAQVLQPGRLPRDYSAAPIEPLVRAATERRTVEIDYDSLSAGERAWRTVDPYAVEPRDGQYWELHGWCHQNVTIRTFALDRVYGVRILDNPFGVRQAEWEQFAATRGIVGGLRGGEPAEVEVRFAPEVAPYARARRWPETLTIREQSDGSLLLTGTVQGVESIVTELLRWRRHAEVRGGPELRARMAEEARAIAALYENEKS
jgi:predicted DNA-binding transcriptional regulator YafY